MENIYIGAEIRDIGGKSMFVNTFWALVPPIIAIALALITKETYSSLFIGILVGAFFVSGGFHPIGALDTMINDGFVPAISDNAGIFMFLVLLGMMVALVNASGGSQAFGRWAKTHIKTRVGAMFATFVLGVLIFIDDYFNCLTVGSVMRPVTDNHKISRPKLAYLIDATAAPVCMIAPVSSWAAAVSGVANDLNSGMSGIELFIKAIPYNFYSLLTFVFIICMCVMKVDFGKMKKFEIKATETGDLSAIAGEVSEEGHPRGRVIDLILPVLVLIITCTVGLLYVGGYFTAGADFAGDFIGAFGNTDAFVGLPWGGLIAIIFAVFYFIIRRIVNFRQAMECLGKGFISMVPAMCILVMAVALKNMTGLLGASEFVQSAMTAASASLYNMLPAVIFIVACLIAFATGTSWGTFGILIPIVTAIFPVDSPLLIIGISACCAGAVCGDHCSPISDTTIMASAGAQCDHLDHVSTQLPYAIFVAVISFVSYAIVGLVAQNALLGFGVGAVLIILFLLFVKKRQDKYGDPEEAVEG